MTTYRHPYDRSKQPSRTERPTLPDWLANPVHALTRMQRHTVDYWLGMYWAAPPWLTDDHIEQLRELWESANPRFDHLDHVVPLHHPLVCGLHVPWNIQKINWRENLSKSNHYWPDCPDHLCPDKNLPVDMFGHSDEPHQMGLL